MESLRRALAVVSAAMAKLTMSQRLLIGAVGVVLAMTLFLVQLYTSTPALVPLLGAGVPADEQQRAVTFLRTSGIEHTVSETGEVMVAPGRVTGILAQMAEAGAMPSDTTVLFDSLIDKQSWVLSQRQNQQLETIAVQNELSAIIGKMTGVRSARVILNLPERRSLGQPATVPTASVTVFPTAPLKQDTVDAIAQLVAGARGIDASRVRVIDGATNRQFRARDESSLNAGSYLEYVAAIEDRKQAQIYDMLSSYIPGVVVAVHAQVDLTSRRRETSQVLPEGKGSVSFLVSEESTERQDREASQGGEPGPRSNTREDISGAGGAGGATSTETKTDTQFRPEAGRQVEVVNDPRGNPTKINAVVNVPRGYFVEMWRSRRPAQDAAAPAGGDTAAPEPPEGELKPLIDEEVARIRRDVELQIDTAAGADTVKGEVQVSMIPVMALLAAPAAAGAGGFLGVPAGSPAMEGLIRTVALGALTLVAMGLVVMTAMRASRRESLPSAAELVGVPPALESTGDLVGEAAEADSVLQGIELSDDEMKHRKMMEQVAEMVQEKPDDAARLLGRWITGT